jgi:membrane-bound serine protease (ClpP class)
VKTADATVTLHTAGADVQEERHTWAEGLLGFIYNPNVVMILFVLATYGIIAELNSPGAVFPGVAGAICLVLALFASSALSVNMTGAILLILAVVLFVIDLHATTHGVLTVGGLIAFVIGALLFFDPGAVGVPISVPLVLTLAIVTALFFGIVMAAAVRSRGLPPGTGPETLIGMVGEARSKIDPRGKVFVEGAFWDAENVGSEQIDVGDRVVVQALDGLMLKVKRTEPHPGEPIWSHNTGAAEQGE